MLVVVESVRCLECGSVYAKPNSGGTVQQNPGCPECGYIGWLSLSVPVSDEFGRRRPAGGRQPPLRAKRR